MREEVRIYLICNTRVQRYFLLEETRKIGISYHNGLISKTIEGAYDNFIKYEKSSSNSITTYGHCEIYDVSSAKNAEEAKKLMLVQKLRK